MKTTQGEHAQTALAHELFAAAQLAPGEGIEDAVSRIVAALTAAPAQPAAPQGVAYAELPTECDSPELCAVSKSCAGQFGTQRICASHGHAPAGAAILCWVNEDELPEGLTQEAYSALFPHSKVDVVRMFPVFGPTAQAAPAAGAVAGWKLVPVEPTPRMWTAGGDAIKACGGHERDAASLAYAAMLAAAPTPAAAPDSVLEDARKENICIDCTNADSWGLPDKPCCQSCVASSNWQPLNRSSVHPNAARKQGGTHD